MITNLWRCGVIGNTRDSDSLVLGSRPNGAANIAISYNGSTGGFEPFGGSSILSVAANLQEKLTMRAVALGGQGLTYVRTWAVRAEDNYERNVHYEW